MGMADKVTRKDIDRIMFRIGKLQLQMQQVQKHVGLIDAADEPADAEPTEPGPSRFAPPPKPAPKPKRNPFAPG